ncbi:YdcF family protein [Chitinolyticbacter albus]|uniref:YdcF family protein n=1 Tax=Chitinolyticbacter albus TaxID=2961951 RepID=UPI00210CED74|nr:YdcF family protein [Chitinolyticbacter albus]
MVDPVVVIKNAIAALMLPPGSLLLLLAVGLLLWRNRPRLARGLVTVATLLLYLLATPGIAYTLLRQLEPEPITPAALDSVAAIVVLGGGKRMPAPDAGLGEAMNNATLTRVHYGARLARSSGKPLLVTGGKPKGGVAEAQLMADALRSDYDIAPRWVESASRNTEENAEFSARLLPASQRRIALVTQAWHMPRAERIFTQADFTVIPAATDYASQEQSAVLRWLPDAEALARSDRALHELLGVLWYRLRGR